MEIKTFGAVDERSLKQLKRCMSAGDAEYGVLCADHHPGYSQPIGGAIGYEGFVSPSGVGYDIGCIAAGTPVTTGDGYTVPIEAVAPSHPVVCWDGVQVLPVAPLEGNIERGRQPTLSVELADGRIVRATHDHEFRTKDGWVRADELDLNDAVAVNPFVGLPYEPLAGEPLEIAPPRREQVARLKEMGLWPVRPSDPRLPALLRVLAYVAGDGNLTPDGKTTCLYTSEADDVADLVADIRQIGFEPRVYSRERGGRTRTQWVVKTGSVHLHALLEALGCPVGKKVAAWPERPMPWLNALPAWARAVFLSAFMSAEGMTPRLTGGAPAPMAVKQAGTTPHAIRFIARLFASLGFDLSVTRSGPARGERQTYVGQVVGGPGETLRYLREVGFNRARAKRVASAAMLSAAVQRTAIVALRSDAIETGRELVAAGHHWESTCDAVALTHRVPTSLVYHGIYGDRGTPRCPKGWRPEPDHSNEVAWLPIVSVTDAGTADVYDVVTGDPAESFFADGVVVHNCGNKAALTNMTRADLDERGVDNVMAEIAKRISFGMGVPAQERVDHPVLDKIKDAPFEPQRALHEKAAAQLGTVGSGNHFVNLFADEQDRLWVGVHFGSRGFGHKTASGFLALAQGLAFDGHAAEGEMDSPPVLLPLDSELGQSYIEAMSLAGEYAYAGRDVVVAKVLEILGAEAVREVHNHHNFAWLEQHHGRDVWVVRKGCTPAQPGQEGFVGGSMGQASVILEGAESEDSVDSLYSTVHGAGRVMSRMQAAGRYKRSTVYECTERDCEFSVPARMFDGQKCPDHPDRKMRKVRKERLVRPGRVDWPKVKRDLAERGIVVVGGGADEAPEVYKRLPEVLAAHGDSIRVKHTLTPLGVAMAGADVFDPYKD